LIHPFKQFSPKEETESRRLNSNKLKLPEGQYLEIAGIN
jgi:hypothetical protein